MTVLKTHITVCWPSPINKYKDYLLKCLLDKKITHIIRKFKYYFSVAVLRCFHILCVMEDISRAKLAYETMS